MIFQNLHLSAPSAVNKFVEHDLFSSVLDAVHPSNPFHLIGSLECFGRTFLVSHLPGEKVDTFNTGMIDLCQMLIQFA